MPLHLQRIADRLNALTSRSLLAAIGAYQYLFSPWVGRHCRFHPTCSRYGQEAIRAHGPWRGGWLIVRRIARCHPLCPGGEDPVPPPRR